ARASIRTCPLSPQTTQRPHPAQVPHSGTATHNWAIGAANIDLAALGAISQGPRRPATLTHCDSYRPTGMLLLTVRSPEMRTVGLWYLRRHCCIVPSLNSVGA